MIVFWLAGSAAVLLTVMLARSWPLSGPPSPCQQQQGSGPGALHKVKYCLTAGMLERKAWDLRTAMLPSPPVETLRSEAPHCDSGFIGEESEPTSSPNEAPGSEGNTENDVCCQTGLLQCLSHGGPSGALGRSQEPGF